MEKKSQDFSMENAIRLAKSPVARQLMDTMRAKDPQALDQAMAQAAAGDYDQVRRELSNLLSSPEIQALLKQLGG